MLRNILAIIPARSGSKSVKDKNIRMMNGQPMISYSIQHALQSKYINRVLVSTDSEQYAQIAREYGAEVPFLRPAEYATDTSLDIEVFEHALRFLKETEDYIPDIVVHLRPTYPIRNVDDIDRMIEIMLENDDADAVRCIAPAKETPYKMWRKGENGKILPLLSDIEEAYNMPRQQLPAVYMQNACIDCIRASVISEQHSMTGKNIYGYEMSDNYDIDTEEEFLRAEQAMNFENVNKTYVFDIDGVIAKKNAGLEYDKALPDLEIIDIINRLYDLGNEIILFTARGFKTGIDWSDVTKRQMESWGVKYTKLMFGKPAGDYYVDDHNLDILTLKQAVRMKGKE